MEISFSPKGLWIEKVREEGQNILVLGSSIVHQLALNTTLPLDCATHAFVDLPHRKNYKN